MRNPRPPKQIVIQCVKTSGYSLCYLTKNACHFYEAQRNEGSPASRLDCYSVGLGFRITMMFMKYRLLVTNNDSGKPKLTNSNKA
jgi:hypothetical protein